MKDRKYQLHIFSNFSLFDSVSIRNHAEKMAAQGWLVDEIGPFLWRYRRIAPQKLHFAAVYLPGYSDCTPQNDEERLDFLEYCGLDGWHLAGCRQSMHLFYNEREDPVPIETDPLTQYREVKSAMLWGRSSPKLSSCSWSFLLSAAFYAESAFCRRRTCQDRMCSYLCCSLSSAFSSVWVSFSLIFCGCGGRKKPPAGASFSSPAGRFMRIFFFWSSAF